MGCKRCTIDCSKGLFFIGFVILLWWLIWQPREVKLYVDHATATNFTLSTLPDTTQLLSFNITIQLSFRNPNKRIKIYYDFLEATVLYDGVQLQSKDLGFFFQHTKSTTVLVPVFHGQQSFNGDNYSKEKSEGFFGVELKVRAKLRRKVLSVRIGPFKPKFDCLVRIPVAGNATSEVAVLPSFKC